MKRYYLLLFLILAVLQFSCDDSDIPEETILWEEVENRIRVVHEMPNDFRFYFNDVDNGAFADDSFDYGDSGFAVSISYYAVNENFPLEPEDIRYKQLNPVEQPK